jgi:hypothetical protein
MMHLVSYDVGGYYSTNLVSADSIDQIKASREYRGRDIVSITEATEEVVEMYKRRGMPVVEIETETQEPQELKPESISLDKWLAQNKAEVVDVVDDNTLYSGKRGYIMVMWVPATAWTCRAVAYYAKYNTPAEWKLMEKWVEMQGEEVD